MPEPAIEVRDLGYRYGKRWAVDGLSFAVPRGSVCGFLGRNGAGKTTTIHMLMGLLKPKRGEARVLGHDPVRDPNAVRRRTGFVAEHQQMYGWMKVKDLIWFTAGFYDDWDQAYADALLRRFDLEPKQKVRNLSKGQQARLAILLAAAFHPELLVLDDPTLGLDPIARQEILGDLIRLLQERGRTVFLSTHLLDELSQVADHVVIIDKGRLIASEPVDQLQARVKEIRLTFSNGTPDMVDVPGLVKLRHFGRQVALTTTQFRPDIIHDIQSRYSTATCETSELSLDRIFSDMVLAESASSIT